MTTHDITLTINGERETATVESRTLLVHALRDLGYTGPKVGCETGSCGACTVHVEGEAVKACTRLAVQEEGREIRTVEGLAGEGDGGGDVLHPIQETFHEAHALQCGYCTPGMVMATADLLENDPDPSRESIRESLKGNRCRCTGYHNIVDAVESLAMDSSAGEGAD
ncbi:(2Fe-2S)-binding protein [Saliphagus infecundisoli]|uniref:(2Fe-2S)-binding protein n=1 Tax=Saliphagus infecundisoli TaxID=1849069 RepID=A0ABD5QGC3_9EURY|nr:(2Fe-2S)-binding protein [Saliphagus infecundisoli]